MNCKNRDKFKPVFCNSISMNFREIPRRFAWCKEFPLILREMGCWIYKKKTEQNWSWSLRSACYKNCLMMKNVRWSHSWVLLLHFLRTIWKCMVFLAKEDQSRFTICHFWLSPCLFFYLILFSPGNSFGDLCNQLVTSSVRWEKNGQDAPGVREVHIFRKFII